MDYAYRGCSTCGGILRWSLALCRRACVLRICVWVLSLVVHRMKRAYHHMLNTCPIITMSHPLEGHSMCCRNVQLPSKVSYQLWPTPRAFLMIALGHALGLSHSGTSNT